MCIYIYIDYKLTCVAWWLVWGYTTRDILGIVLFHEMNILCLTNLVEYQDDLSVSETGGIHPSKSYFDGKNDA